MLNLPGVFCAGFEANAGCGRWTSGASGPTPLQAAMEPCHGRLLRPGGVTPTSFCTDSYGCTLLLVQRVTTPEL